MEVLRTKLREVQKELVVPKGQKNTFGNYQFRSCGDILEKVKPLLMEREMTLILSDDLVNLGDRYYVKATATIHCGQEHISVNSFARESENHKGFDQSQITGAASSYARKYALSALFAIDDTKDADTQDNRNTEEPRKSTPPSSPATEANSQEGVPILKTAMDLAKNKFKELDEFKVWRIDAGLAEDLTKATDFEVLRVIMKLKEIK